MFVAQPLCSAQTDPIDDGGMVQLVRQHCVVWAQQNLVEEQNDSLLAPNRMNPSSLQETVGYKDVPQTVQRWHQNS